VWGSIDLSQPFSTWPCSTVGIDQIACNQGGGMMRLRVGEMERAMQTAIAEGSRPLWQFAPKEDVKLARSVDECGKTL
jgi:hypothetical protein